MTRVQRWIRSGAMLGTIVVAGAELSAAQPLARNRIDAREIEMMTERHPVAVGLLEQGEAALRAGRVEAASSLFAQASKEAPDRALPARRHCQTLGLLGRTAEAKQACTLAIAAVGSALDARAMVGAWLSNQNPPTPAELIQITELAQRAQQLSHQEPWGYAADCDIARRIGDTSMLKECILQLSRIAPEHYETLRARAAAAEFSSPLLRWSGLAALVVLCVATGGFALRSRFTSRSSVSRDGLRAASVLVLLLLGLLSTKMAFAQMSESGGNGIEDADEDAPSRPLGQLSRKFPVDLSDPTKSIPSVASRNKDPIQFGYWLMDLSLLADNAFKKGNYSDSAKFFEAVVMAVPDRAIGHSKLCRAYLAMGARDKAATPCKKALAFEGATVDDHIRYSRLLISKQGQMAPQEIADVDAQVKHLQDGKLDAPANRLACELAVKLDDAKRLESCTAGLVKVAPEDLGTVSFQWALALKEGDFPAAERAVKHAEALGMTDAGLEKMRSGTEEMKPLWRLALAHWRGVAGSLLFLFAVIVLFVTWRRTSAGRDAQPA